MKPETFHDMMEQNVRDMSDTPGQKVDLEAKMNESIYKRNMEQLVVEVSDRLEGSFMQDMLS